MATRDETTTVATCRVAVAKSGCPIIVPIGDSTTADVLRWAHEVAGLTPRDIRRSQDGEILLKVSGVRKLAPMAPDTALKMSFMAWLQDEFPEATR